MPWGRLDDSLYDHPKLELLPAEHRLAGVGLWARSISWCNRFLTDGQVPRARVERLDGTVELADALVAAGLFEETATGYAIHDFLEFNDSREDVMKRRDSEARRKAEWRKNRRPAGTTTGTGSDDEPRPAGTHRGTKARAEHDVPLSVPAGHDSNGSSPNQPVPRFPARVTRATRNANPDPTRPDPTHESLSSGEDSRPGARARRPDIAALRDRGWKRVSKAQRAMLDEIAGRHGQEFAAIAIRSTGPDHDPLEMVKRADAMATRARRAQVDEAEAGWSETKGADAGPAVERIAWLEEQTGVTLTKPMPGRAAAEAKR